MTSGCIPPSNYIVINKYRDNINIASCVTGRGKEHHFRKCKGHILIIISDAISLSNNRSVNKIDGNKHLVPTTSNYDVLTTTIQLRDMQRYWTKYIPMTLT